MSQSGPPERASLASALEEEEARLRQLEAERAGAKARADALRSQLAALDETPVVRGETVTTSVTAPRSPTEKVRLFRQLFRGRDDLYPTRYVSKTTGKPGYAPACSNKWEVGLCALKTGGKCSDCTNQAFRRVDDLAVLGHLRGKHVMGVYAMLPDETCWFLAVDFDKSTWKEDVRAFAETARRLDLPVLVERSRSGNGAHVWFFFSEPVPASVARKMGCHVVTETMSARHELSMDSYDRLFPSQDTMPRGGFGNLIALPLQYEPRQQGNSVFLDDQKTESIGSTTHVWGYTFDATGRLTDVTKDGNAMSHYGYDADDNRTSYSGVRSAPRTTRKIACSRTALRATRTPPTASF